MKRITLTNYVPDLDPEEAKKLLRTKNLGVEGLSPIYEAMEVLRKAYPDAVRYLEGGRRVTNWRRLLERVLYDFVPAFKEGKAQGRRPTEGKSGLVRRVDDLVESGEARSKTHAFAKLHKEFPESRDLKQTYYREKKKVAEQKRRIRK